MEEVVGSNPTRSTKIPQTLTAHPVPGSVVAGVQLESKPHLMHGQPWASCGFRCCPALALHLQCDRRSGHCGHRFSRLLFAGDDNILFPIQEGAHRAPRRRWWVTFWVTRHSGLARVRGGGDISDNATYRSEPRRFPSSAVSQSRAASLDDAVARRRQGYSRSQRCGRIFGRSLRDVSGTVS